MIFEYKERIDQAVSDLQKYLSTTYGDVDVLEAEFKENENAVTKMLNMGFVLFAVSLDLNKDASSQMLLLNLYFRFDLAPSMSVKFILNLLRDNTLKPYTILDIDEFLIDENGKILLGEAVGKYFYDKKVSNKTVMSNKMMDNILKHANPDIIPSCWDPKL